MAMIIDGKEISLQVKDEIKKKVEALKGQGKEITLAVIQVGDNPASTVYVRNKKRGCEYTGIRSLSYELPGDAAEEELLSLVGELNERGDVNGILVQLPLPPHMDEDRVISAISPLKDVDGFHPQNVGNLCIGRPGFVSCTPLGIIQLLKRSGISIEGKKCVVLGRSNIVGKPMALLLLRENATVTIAHSRTQNLKEVTREADILIVAVVIDVGINRDENNKLCGDVDFDTVEPVSSAITPVPGGVGPMTIAMLLHNCLESIERE